MFDTTATKKHRVVLADYDYHRDIKVRLLLSNLCDFDRLVIEEILFSPIRASVRKIATHLTCSEGELRPVLEKLEKAGLLTVIEDSIEVDKEGRRCFEIEMGKFAEGFTPGMEFLQSLLKKLPIHLLPVWYAIPRTSSNIFDSVIEKYLETPQIFQRYLLDIHFDIPTVAAIAQTLLSSPDLEIPARHLMEQFQLSPAQFEEYLLILEFHFICCIQYRKIPGGWEERVSAFHEWKEYQQFLTSTLPRPITQNKQIDCLHPSDFAFVEDLSVLVRLTQTSSLGSDFETLLSSFPTKREPGYVQHLIDKMKALSFVDDTGFQTSSGSQWLEMRVEDRALYLYRHTLNRLQTFPDLTEKVLREAEKSISRVVYCEWVLWEPFLKSISIPLGDHPPISLKKIGKQWKYALPQYTSEEQELIRRVIFEWFFEIGVTSIGTCQGQPCFKVTRFGQSLFG